ncbi:SelB C-terminal domain-containing protein [Pseudonocardia oroxyli]|uniref:Selenocysteine-specific elongation factor n=1 Tax=Pseudonocardia oroxyli TaxID=366584 RepID=A0A1G7X897_PSEOR|nr:SelB C-terminal domain-containing protein [Pseudonocardia oroxyli]SDG80402.1 selenocysteine-specific elongation factor [Pseudonocardia oroxyli]
MRTHVVATAGHVDHGKSTLVRALTGMEPDRYAEERRRGMTLDLGFAWARIGEDSVAFVDVPGHERFVTTMLAGVGPVPAVLLVVAADGGWMPQTAEHAEALAALGVRHGLLVVTRSDLLEPELALAEAREQLPDWPAVAVSGATGAGLDELRTALHALVRGLPEPDPAAPVRFWVDRAFTVRGAGTVVTGTLAEGTLSREDELVLGDRRIGVRGLESLGETVRTARGVTRVAANLRGIGVDEIGRGAALCTPGAWLTVSELDGRVHGSAADLPRAPILHIGSAAVSVRVRPLGEDVVRLRLDRPLPLRIGDRVVLRDPGRRAVTGLTVLDVRPPQLRRRGAARARAAELAAVTGAPDAADELRRRGTVRAADLVAMGVPAAAVEAVSALRGGGWLLAPARVPALVEALRAAVTAHDRADPLDPGLPIEAARHALGLPHPALVAELLTGQDTLVARDGRIRRAIDAGLPDALRTALDAVRSDLAVAPFAAPDAERLADLGLGPKQVATLVRAGELSTVGDGVLLLPDAEDRAVEILRGLPETFTLSEAREALGTTRRVAVPLLEHLARRRRTVRTDDGRHRLR